MNRHLTRGAAIAASATLLLSGCANDEDQDETASTPPSPPVTETDWFTERFSSAPVFVDAATENAQTHRPDNNAGEPLPENAPEGEVVWQAPACVPIPFTSDGPRSSFLDTGVLHVSGYEQTELGAAAAAVGLSSTSLATTDQPRAVSVATGLTLPEAERIVATSEVFDLKPEFRESLGEPCRTTDFRPTAYRVADMTDSYAVVDLFSPASNNPGNGATIRLSVEWTGDDWRLAPSSFDSYADSLEAFSSNRGAKVDLAEFTQW
ncbi:hypothetical protein G6016_08835 [Dietzia aerolata]|uniref:DUF8175 domain-containing protein n=1 Tax=Dietzia aerolata TaxID=595984 RepID=A0ABV5JT94_9ACTN|nr:hypothetical protein [Dietzia aerolata]MBB0969061.1 hypothetical protein [Dietzia aerolata]